MIKGEVMRDIEFRGMSISGNWVYGLLSISQGFPSQPQQGYYISNSAGCPWSFSVRPETVGQYSGLKDKTGAKIFEGDEISLYYEESFFSDMIQGFITWDDSGQYMIECGSVSISLVDIDFSFSEPEVIGNIHTDKALQEVK